MPDINRPASPVVGSPFRVRAWTLVVTIECLQCDAHAVVSLVNTTEAKCPNCGAEYQCGGMRWDGSTPLPPPPQFAIAAGSPTTTAGVM